jgi:hypothetical protein
MELSRSKEIILMSDYLPLLLLALCPVGMGLMMWVMMRKPQPSGSGGDNATLQAQERQVAALRTEVDQLRIQQRPVPENRLE